MTEDKAEEKSASHVSTSRKYRADISLSGVFTHLCFLEELPCPVQLLDTSLGRCAKTSYVFLREREDKDVKLTFVLLYCTAERNTRNVCNRWLGWGCTLVIEKFVVALRMALSSELRAQRHMPRHTRMSRTFVRCGWRLREVRCPAVPANTVQMRLRRHSAAYSKVQLHPPAILGGPWVEMRLRGEDRHTTAPSETCSTPECSE